MSSWFRTWLPITGPASTYSDDGYQWLIPPGVRQLLQVLVSVNEGLEFVPLLASWLFLLAAINLAFPGLLPSFTGTRLRRNMRWVMRLFMPWVMFCLAWRPFNHALLTIFTRYARLPCLVRAQWLPFSSMIAAMWTLLASLKQTGYLLLISGRRQRRRRSSGNRQRQTVPTLEPIEETGLVRRRTRSGLLLPSSPGMTNTTRSGAVYGE